ncbi:contractile injection system tape measure protein [Saccharicrinis sp. FJH54]|uniref:contractile injection system tape measure protein n=1 Tax=Saccharicrinis sp. FJH54 TaxID=3344665 RepID=UPI0035D44234
MLEHSVKIEKLFVEVNTSSKEKADRINSDIEVFVNERLLPELEEILKKNDSPTVYYRIQKLTLTGNISNWDNSELLLSGIPDELSRQIAALQDSVAEKEQMPKQSEEEMLGEMFLYYLKSGFLPWFGSMLHLQQFISGTWKDTVQYKSFINEFTKTLAFNIFSARRFLFTASPEMQKYVFENILPLSPDLMRDIKQKSNPDLITAMIYAVACIHWMKQNSVNLNLKDIEPMVSDILTTFPQFREKQELKRIQNLISQITASHLEIPSKVESVFAQVSWVKPEKKNLASNDIVNDEIWVENAGLILMHPFLPGFFRKTGILTKDNGIKEPKLNLAVQVLHYLATGKETAHEAEMVLERVLCGIPLLYPVKTEEPLSDDIKRAAVHMLEALIGHWPALKQTSPDGLRQLFFCREGKMKEEENHYSLIVERKAQDILLDRLNWNISFFSLPWLDKMIHIVW